MRVIFSMLGSILAIMALFKWRYKILNGLLGIRAVNKLFVSNLMKVPTIKKKVSASFSSNDK